jgi:ubiquitin carboxyl-terminal hydrolase 10
MQPVQLGLSGLSEASQQALIKVLPPVLVLHLKRFLYDAAADSIVKVNKPVQFAPELEIPIGTIFSFVSESRANQR